MFDSIALLSPPLIILIAPLIVSNTSINVNDITAAVGELFLNLSVLYSIDIDN